MGAPSTIFVNSMSDLFHEAIPAEFVRQVFEVMEAPTPYVPDAHQTTRSG